MPTRSCVICRLKNEKANLLRIVSNKYDEAILDRTQKNNSRAIYICNNIECVEKAIKILKRGKMKLKIGINNDSLEVLLNEIKNELEE